MTNWRNTNNLQKIAGKFLDYFEINLNIQYISRQKLYVNKIKQLTESKHTVEMYQQIAESKIKNSE